jgi:transcriptional regulator with XRE-family HTH domain
MKFPNGEITPSRDGASEGLMAKARNDTQRPTLGKLVATVRQSNDWTLKQLSEKVGIPLSTLAKVEADKLSLNYEKLMQFTASLGMTMAEFLAGPYTQGHADAGPVIVGRRSVTSDSTTVRINTASYDYDYLCSDLSGKRMVPILSRIHTKSLEEFGRLVHHEGEEFAYVLEGAVEVHLQYYIPVVLSAGQGIYIDSAMGHAYLAKDCDSALMMVICSSDARTLQAELMELASSEGGT